MHLYGFMATSDASIVDLEMIRGIGDAPLRALDAAGITALVSDAPAERASGEAAMAGVRAHNAVLQCALDGNVTPLPARYGQRFADDARCVASFVPRAAGIAAQLARLAGMVEMTIVISPSVRTTLEPLQPVRAKQFDTRDPSAGRQYLETLRAREAAVSRALRGSAEIADRLTDAVRAFVETTAAPSPARVPVRTLSHLVRRTNAEGYRQAVGRTPASAHFRVVVIGPRPPFSFSVLDDEPRRGTNLAG